MPETPLIRPWPATQETIASRMLWLADSYAEGALVLCCSMSANDYGRQYTSTRVILHLCRHATELFFKGAVLSKTEGPPPKTHRLDKLYAEYRRHYPSEEFDLDLPFFREVFDSGYELFPDLLDDYKKTHDQRFRYPMDSNGNPFDERESFDVEAYQLAINRFRTSINFAVARIEWASDS